MNKEKDIHEYIAMVIFGMASIFLIPLFIISYPFYKLGKWVINKLTP